VGYGPALSGRKKALGAEHMTTIKTFNNLGSLHISQGRLAGVEEVHKRAPSEYQKTLGEEHIDTICTLKTLALFRQQHYLPNLSINRLFGD